MLTIIESPLFTKLWPDYWSEEERAEFAGYIAVNPEAGDVVPGSGGYPVGEKGCWEARRGKGDLYHALGQRRGCITCYVCQEC